MKKSNGDSQTSLLIHLPAITTNQRHRPLIDPVVLIVLIPPILVLLFLLCLSHVPESIKPTSFISTLSCFNLFLVLIAILFRVFYPEDNESSTNQVESYEYEDVNDENLFYDADWHMSDEAMNASGNSDDQRTPTPPPVPWIHVKNNKLDLQLGDIASQRASSDDQRKRKRRHYRRKVKFIRRVRLSIPPTPASAPTPILVQDKAPTTAAAAASTPTSARAPSPPPSIFNMFKNRKKSKQIHSVTTPPAPLPPPPPSRSFFPNIFTPGNKNKKHPSSKTSKLPPRPPLPPTRPPQQLEPQRYDRNTSTSSTSQSSWTPQPPQRKQEPQQHYNRQTSMSSSSESSYIPRPPPPPPFDMPEKRYKYYGDHLVRLRSYNSNTSSSPDIQPMSQPSTSMDGGDCFWSSPDVNAKADIYISRGKDQWKMEQENTIKKKGGTSFINKPKKTNLNSMKSHLYP